MTDTERTNELELINDNLHTELASIDIQFYYSYRKTNDTLRWTSIAINTFLNDLY
jgi:hypothetical protein